MTYFYSPGTSGFYSDVIHPNLPSDCIQISDSEYQTLLDGQSSGKKIVSLQGTVTLVDPTKTVMTWDEIRAARDNKLAACDWTQIPDSPLTQTVKMNWKSYRQLLRDLTSTYSDPTLVVWPTAPDGSS